MKAFRPFAVVLGCICIASTASASIQFAVSDVTINTSGVNSGFAINSSSSIPNRPALFSLTNVGDSVTVDVFSLTTAIASVGGAQPIQVDFQFSQPTSTTVVATSSKSKGGGGFTGTLQGNAITWNGPTQMSFGPNGDGILEILLSNAVMSPALDPSASRSGANITGTFTLISQPSAIAGQVPEPGTLAIWSLLSMIGVVVAYKQRKK